MTTTLAKQFINPAAAEEFYCTQQQCQLQTNPPPFLSSSQIYQLTEEHGIAVCQQVFASLEFDQQLIFLSEAFCDYLKQNTHVQDVPHDFLQLLVEGMEQLHVAGRTNVIYLLAKALDTLRPDSSESLLPTRRMPMGMLEYIVIYIVIFHCFLSATGLLILI